MRASLRHWQGSQRYPAGNMGPVSQGGGRVQVQPANDANARWSRRAMPVPGAVERRRGQAQTADQPEPWLYRWLVFRSALVHERIG